jgi:hypothetical protein
MGPLLFTGLALFGATIGLGRLTTGAISGGSPVAVGSPLRRAAVIVSAFITGCGVIGVVVGLLATTGDLQVTGTGALLAVALACVGATIGQLPVIKAGSEIDGRIAWLLRMFVGALVTLGIVVAILAVSIGHAEGPSPDPLPFAILGALSACGTIGLGIAGARGLRSVAGLPDGPLAAQAVSGVVSRVVPFQAISVIASAVAIVLIYTGAPS